MCEEHIQNIQELLQLRNSNFGIFSYPLKGLMLVGSYPTYYIVTLQNDKSKSVPQNWLSPLGQMDK